MSTLAQHRIIDPVLTQYLLGYKNASLIGEKLFVRIPVPKSKTQIPQWGKEHFRIRPTLRAPGGATNRGKVEIGTPITLTTRERDWAHPVDTQELQDSIDAEGLRRRSIFTSAEIIKLGHEKECADLAQNAANYAASNKVTLSGTTQWTHASSTPIVDIKTGREAVRSDIGQYPNTLILGASAYKSLSEHSTIIERIKYSQLGVVTPDLLKAILDIPNILIGAAIYADEAGAFTDIWDDNAILAYVAPNLQDEMTPTFGLTPQREGFPQADVYFNEGGKVTLFRATDNYDVKIVGADAGYLIKDTNA